MGFQNLKGTVSVISSNPQCKDGNARLTVNGTFLIGLSDQVWMIHVFVRFNCLFLFVAKRRFYRYRLKSDIAIFAHGESPEITLTVPLIEK